MAATAIPLRGRLEDHPVAAVLKMLLRGRRDGCLEVTRGGITRRVYLREGMIVYGSSNERQDRLGEVLIAQGKLSRADLKRYWERSQAENRLLGITLVLNGRITQNDLYQGVTAQVATILDRLQKWSKGEYVFSEGEAPGPGTVLLRIPLALYLRGESGGSKDAKDAKAPARAAGKRKAAAKPAKSAKPAKASPGSRRKRKPAAAEPPPEEPAAEVQAPPAPETGTEPAADLAPEPAAETAPEPAADRAADSVAETAAEAADAGGDEGEEITLVEEDEGGVPAISPEEAAEQERIGEISFTVQELAKRLNQGPETVLGVLPGADRALVLAAHRRLVRTLHPDHFPAALPEQLAREAENALRAVNGALEAIEARLRVATPPPAEFAPPPGRVRTEQAESEARRHFREGRELIAKRSYAQAASSLRQAVRLAPREAVYRQYLGLALMQIKRLHEAEEHLVEAVRIEPANAMHHLNLARIYRAGKLNRKARDSYERALRLDPRNTHAREELAELPEEQPAARKNGGSLLRRLFGKG